MRISVIIPCHNAGRWIGETLRSVAAQSLPSHEVIVIDDSSTDDSVEQIRRSGVDVKLISVQCRNAAATRNAGVEAATGDWIAILDADDIWHPNHLARAAEVLAGTKDIAYRALCEDLTVAGERLPPPPQPLTGTRTGLTHHDAISLEHKGLYFGHSSFVLRLDRFREIGGYAPEQVRRHDFDMWLRLIHGHTWSWDSTATVTYRYDTPGSISQSYAACEYFYLKALIRNRERYAGREMDAMLEGIARRVMTLGFVDGDEVEYQRARDIAWEFLPWHVRCAYSFAGLAPMLARRVIRLKRTIYTWRTGYRMELPPAEARS